MTSLVLTCHSTPELEANEARALMQWAALVKLKSGDTVADYLIHIPNGAYLGGSPRQRGFQMHRLKQQGLKPGVSDYFLAIPAYSDAVIAAGLWVELKRTHGGRTTPEQKAFGARMTAIGYLFTVANGWEEAARSILHYLGKSGVQQ